MLYRLCAERRRRCWSLEYVGRQINATAFEIRDWEKGHALPPPDAVQRLCTLFDVAPDEVGLTVDTTGEAIFLPPSLSVETPTQAIYDPTIPLPSLPLLLIGRKQEVDILKTRLLSARAVAFSAINGLPGVGKTTLALELAYKEEVQAHFKHGILWASLGTTPNIQGVLSRWGSLLGVSAAEAAKVKNVEEWARVLRAAIGQCKFLLILDDVWQLDAALACKVGGPNCGYVLTTRFPQIALAFAADGTTVIEELDEEKSLLLLKTLAPEVVEHETVQIRALVRAVGGLPLALSLIGNYLRTQAHNSPPRRVRAALIRLHDAQERLRLSHQQHTPTHAQLLPDAPVSLQAVISVSDQQLEVLAQTALRALSVFPAKPNSFSEEMALVVSGATVETLDVLCDVGLLESAGPGRYTLHQTIADYARVHLTDAEPHERFIAYSIAYMEQYNDNPNDLERESNILLAALETAYNLAYEKDFVRGVLACMPFLLSHGLYALAERHLQRALEMDTQATSKNLTCILRYLGEVKQKQGSFSQAQEYYQDGLALAQQNSDIEQQCTLLASLGLLMEKRGMYEQAEVYVQEGLHLAQQDDDKRQMSVFLRLLGLLSDHLGHYARAEAYLQEGLAITRRIGDRELICALLNNIGMVANNMGKYLQAEDYLQEGLSISHQMGYREWTVLLLLNLGVVAANRGTKEHLPEELLRAEQYNQESLTLARQMGHREWCCSLLVNLGEMALFQGELVKADVYVREALDIAYQIEKPVSTCNALLVLGNLYMRQQQIEQAEVAFQEALSTLPPGVRYQKAMLDYGLAQVAEARGNLSQGDILGEASLATLEAIAVIALSRFEHGLPFPEKK